MKFFRYSLPVDPSRIQFNFEKTLKRHCIAVTPNALDALFAKLKTMGSADGGTSDSPFPLVRSVAAAHSHAKRMKSALGGKAGPKLGKCQQVLSDFYGFGKWDFFTSALIEFSKVQMGAETQVTSEVLQSVPVAGLPQETAPRPSRLTVVEAARAAAEEEADRQWALEEAARIAAEEEADRQWALEEAARIAAEEEADRQWALEEAVRMAAEEEGDYEWADCQDLGEDDFYVGPRDWVNKLDPEVQQFASQFTSEEEFDEYMERF